MLYKLSSSQDLVVGLVLFKTYVYYIFSSSVGTWRAGVPAEMDFDVALFNANRVYKIVAVIQPPFMQWNETLREKTNFSLLFYMKNYFVESYEGYCYELIVEVAKILKWA